MLRTEILDTPSGAFIGLAGDNGVTASIRRAGVFGYGEIALYSRILGPTDTFVDVGLNIGAISFFLKQRLPGLRVVGFEPQRSLFAVAAANLVHFPGCEIFNQAVGARDETVLFPDLPDHENWNFGATSRETPAKHRTPVPQIRLDRFLTEREITPRLIKVDVEGAEDQVLEGLSGLPEPWPVLSLEADRPDTVERYLDVLTRMPGPIYLMTLRLEPPRDAPDAPHPPLATLQIVHSSQGPIPFCETHGKRIGSIAEFCRLTDYLRP